jgi:hypothetical protein
VLAACLKNRILSLYIPEDLLRGLFDKTISFLDIVAVPSSSLMIDKRILEGLRNDLWPPPMNASAMVYS